MSRLGAHVERCKACTNRATTGKWCTVGLVLYRMEMRAGVAPTTTTTATTRDEDVDRWMRDARATLEQDDWRTDENAVAVLLYRAAVLLGQAVIGHTFGSSPPGPDAKTIQIRVSMPRGSDE